MKRWLGPIVAALCLAGCASTPNESFYRLPMPAVPVAATAGTKPVSIAVGAVGLPELFDRPQLVTMTTASATQVQIWESQRWAEPLRDGIGRALAARLAVELAPAEALAWPLVGTGEPGYRVSVNLLRFDGELGRGVDDAWQWTVRRVADGAQVAGRGAAQAPAGSGHEGLVAAHGAALDALAREVAQAIRSLPAVTKP